MKYRIQIQYSPEDEGYIATVPELPGCSAFGDTIEDAAREIQVVADAWVDTARTSHREVPEPSAERAYSGKLVRRMPPDLHRALDEGATDAHVSLNQYLVYLLARAIGQYEATKVTGSWTTHIDLLSKKAWERFCEPTRHQFLTQHPSWEAMRGPFETTVRDLLQEEHKSHLWSLVFASRIKKKVPEEE
jgi:predicted RNase H-like HicB family nuclease